MSYYTSSSRRACSDYQHYYSKGFCPSSNASASSILSTFIERFRHSYSRSTLAVNSKFDSVRLSKRLSKRLSRRLSGTITSRSIFDTSKAGYALALSKSALDYGPLRAVSSPAKSSSSSLTENNDSLSALKDFFSSMIDLISSSINFSSIDFISSSIYFSSSFADSLSSIIG